MKPPVCSYRDQRRASVGIDIVEVERIARLVRNTRFLTRIFSKREISYCSKKRNSAQHFAVRFAAKEAVYKALDGQWSPKRGETALAHKNISIRNTPTGRPEVELGGSLRRFEKEVTISLSHTSQTAVAVAFFQKGNL
ncbi:MAG TPA: holo-ACP synthase [Elusimicrobiota bacterium]|nr:holo-ACP synthase [Elusimicrobiota bacterium]